MPAKQPVKAKNKASPSHVWNLSLLYKSANDPQIEKDIVAFETMIDSFAKKYDTVKKDFLVDDSVLLSALTAYEKIIENIGVRPLHYFHFIKDTDASNTEASAKFALIENRLNISINKITFFSVLLGKLDKERQKVILANEDFRHFRIMLERIFHDATYTLSVLEENILSIKSVPGHSMWVSANEKVLNMKSIRWHGKEMPIPTAMQEIKNLSKYSDRKKMSDLVNEALKTVAPFTEAEINAIFTNKKLDDELRGFKEPYESTVLAYRNDPKIVDLLRKVVGENVSISHSFYKVKARLLKQKKLSYFDRATKVGKINSTYSFEATMSSLKEVFGAINPKFRNILDAYMVKGQIDAYPRVGKRGGAYCASSYGNPTFVLLNHIGDLNSYMTCAHELGHAIHGELSESQGALYCDYSFSLAETASTLFEAIALDGIYNSLSDKEKTVILHDRINDDIATIFRQIAGFNFELELHKAIRTKGYVSKEEIADMHNKNMSDYLGPLFVLTRDDGYFFVAWEHIRYFFYMYSYAYGQLVSKALLRRYKKDPTFWTKIEQFLSAGGKDSPENILKDIGIDVSSPEFFKEGLMEIADDIAELDRLTKKVKFK